MTRAKLTSSPLRMEVKISRAERAQGGCFDGKNVGSQTPVAPKQLVLVDLALFGNPFSRAILQPLEGTSQCYQARAITQNDKKKRLLLSQEQPTASIGPSLLVFPSTGIEALKRKQNFEAANPSFRSPSTERGISPMNYDS
jgi:hypothetical protein